MRIAPGMLHLQHTRKPCLLSPLRKSENSLNGFQNVFPCILAEIVDNAS